MSSVSARPPRGVASVKHHPAIAAYKPVTAVVPSMFEIDFLGTRTRRSFYTHPSEVEKDTPPRSVTTDYPAINEEYFEWIDLLETIEQASEDYVIVELGAGYGRWCMRAAAAVRRRPGCRFHCVAVEAEPDHFRWLTQHFGDNGVDPLDHDLIWGAVAATPGFVPFRIGRAAEWYGQRMVADDRLPALTVRERRRLKARSALGRPPSISSAEPSVTWVPCVTLADALASHSRIDLVDIDVQRAEADVIAPAMDVLTERVRRIHIGTHTASVEQRLREEFTAHGWAKVYDYQCKTRCSTPYGEIAFGDGVQTWVNPACGRATPRRRAAKRVLALSRRVERLQARNRKLRTERAALRARYRALERKLADLKGSRAWPLAILSRWFTGRR